MKIVFLRFESCVQTMVESKFMLVLVLSRNRRRWDEGKVVRAPMAFIEADETMVSMSEFIELQDEPDSEVVESMERRDEADEVDEVDFGKNLPG